MHKVLADVNVVGTLFDGPVFSGWMNRTCKTDKILRSSSTFDCYFQFGVEVHRGWLWLACLFCRFEQCSDMGFSFLFTHALFSPIVSLIISTSNPFFPKEISVLLTDNYQCKQDSMRIMLPFMFWYNLVRLKVSFFWLAATGQI